MCLRKSVKTAELKGFPSQDIRACFFSIKGTTQTLQSVAYQDRSMLVCAEPVRISVPLTPGSMHSSFLQSVLFPSQIQLGTQISRSSPRKPAFPILYPGLVQTGDVRGEDTPFWKPEMYGWLCSMLCFICERGLVLTVQAHEAACLPTWFMAFPLDLQFIMILCFSESQIFSTSHAWIFTLQVPF